MRLRATVTEASIENYTLRAVLTAGGRHIYTEAPLDTDLFVRFVTASGITRLTDTAQFIGVEMAVEFQEVAIKKTGFSICIATDWYRCPPNSQSV